MKEELQKMERLRDMKKTSFRNIFFSGANGKISTVLDGLVRRLLGMANQLQKFIPNL
ncbi:unnamed protein product [Clavelina lepadiformis]|uniref:Uncharacterized protein n=1 Tax=Clavelina lepadiformis TaxID=159417 RepID=A0ABP0GF10_CLALP